MRYNLSRFQGLLLASLACLSVDWGRAALGQEMHEFFNNTHQSPAAVDYGAAYYTRGRWYDNAPSVVTAVPPRQASLGYGELSITSWLGRRASGIAYLGVQLDRRVPATAKVSRVEADSPAAQAGLQPGDVIRAVNGQAVGSIEDLPRQIARLTPGERVRLSVERVAPPAAR